ncbi:hypothetical protein DB30_07125 [Enhygromyxa salina]|uniref:Phosphatase n=1 Tax=Enhygromyxa salina TaxID=215803 RepID=A0A0C1Z955_9BACT|nr:alkaline phosphatase PhoX [Enhygromyxa salina]KIG14129.1 hypothetical protein DB30_07125 [Enhygromyxa salina]
MLTRRRLLTATGVALCFAALGRSREARARGRWGDPIPDPDGILDLPAGFSYAILETAGDLMSDGYKLPARPDGMACFPGPDGTLILMRNHENSVGAATGGPYADGQSAPPEAYNPKGMGGVSRLVIDAQTFARVSSNLVLIGTSRNCAGGPSPWGWLSCEESVLIDGAYRHGYVFLCPTNADTVQLPDRKLGYGRFFHEAAAIDPATNIAYLTEDRFDSCLYRFVPDDPAAPFVGSLQALKVVGEDKFPTTTLQLGAVLEVEWVTIDDPDPSTDSVRGQGHAKGAALITRGEGMWSVDGQVFFTATTGGPLGLGQIFRLVDGAAPTLELLAHADDPTTLEMPDNITVAPWGELFLVEDGPANNSIRWLGADGQLCRFASTSLYELAGICFSPDARAMFVNIQVAGLTLVITGPFVDDGGEEGGDGWAGDSEGGADPGAEGGTAAPPTEVGSACACSSVGEDPLDGSASTLAILTAAWVATRPPKPGER